MRVVNVWIALRDDAQASIRQRVTWDEESQGPYTGPVTNREFRVFAKIGHLGAQRLWRVDTDGGRQWTVWSIYFSENLAAARTEIDKILADRPNVVRIVGAWWDDSRQVGTEWAFGDVTRSTTIDDPAYVAPAIPQVQNPNYQGPNVGLNPIGPSNGEPEFIDDPRYVATTIPQIAGPDETRSEIIGVTGTPTYPIHPRILESLHDIVTHDGDGNETSRIRPTDLATANVVAGQAVRRM